MTAAWVVTAVVFAFVLTRPVNAVCARRDQSNNVNYQSYDPYVLYVRDRSEWWNVFDRNRRCEIGVVAARHGEFLYGHWVTYDFQNHTNEPDYFARCAVTWATDGVTVTEPTGHRLFIPKNAFVGGR
ncbi:MAG: hypothetical protein J0I06_23310 [Planctomycetes bacterium]|nr:hypothetical protein [Planctomycetota bacterium]